MKVLLFIPQRYGLYRPLRDAFAHLGAQVHSLDYEDFIRSWEKKTNTQIFRFPDKWRKKWEAYYFRRINDQYLAAYEKHRPDLVFIYNNAMLLPETLAHFKQKSKVAFFLGDHPFYTRTNRYFLSLLFYGDAIFAPDSFWISQLRKMGLNNLYHFYPGVPKDEYYPVKLPADRYEALKTDILYVGNCYVDSWGYKKARFLSHFTGFDFQLLGRGHWQRWFSFFPELKQHYQKLDRFLPVAELNERLNATRIMPIDGNPGVLHGLHFRLFEALAAGVLPLLEWQEDLTHIFGDQFDLPAARSYDEIRDMTQYYLNDEPARRETVRRMQQIVEEKYSLENNADLIDQALQLSFNHSTL